METGSNCAGYKKVTLNAMTGWAESKTTETIHDGTLKKNPVLFMRIVLL